VKILVLSYEYPPIGGGGGVICKNISENLAGLGHEVIVMTTDFHEIPNSIRQLADQIPNKTQTQNSKIQNSIQHSTFNIQHLKLIRLPARRERAYESNPLEMLSWIREAKRYIRTHPGFVDFDVCMAHFVLPGGEVARWLKKKYGLPYVLVSHGHDIPWVHPRQMFFYHLGAYGWIKNICRQSSLNFIQTSMMKENIDRFLGKKYEGKNTIIPNGVDTSNFYPDHSKRPEHLRILFIGRLVIQKDPMTFLNAVRLFSKETHDFEVRILGDGHLRKKMERYVIKNGLAGNVKFCGKIPEEQMLQEYQAAHLMVAPSLNEGMSISALEALSCGIYLIATRASGFEDMITENVNGELVNFRDPQSIYQKLKNFSGMTERGNTVPQKYLRQIPEIYSWEAISCQYSNLMYTIIVSHSPERRSRSLE